MEDEKDLLPPGFCFQPTDEQLITNYLRPLVTGQPLPCPDVIIKHDLYGPHAEISTIFEYGTCVCSHYDEDEDVLYFYTTLKKKYGNGSRIDRVAGSGTWTGQDGERDIYDKHGRVIGKKKHYSFDMNKKRKKTSPADVSWIMCEYTLAPPPASSSSTNQNSENKQMEHVLCRIRRKRAKASSTRQRVDEEYEVQAATAAAIAYINSPGPSNNAPVALMNGDEIVQQPIIQMAPKRMCHQRTIAPMQMSTDMIVENHQRTTTRMPMSRDMIVNQSSATSNYNEEPFSFPSYGYPPYAQHHINNPLMMGNQPSSMVYQDAMTSAPIHQSSQICHQSNDHEFVLDHQYPPPPQQQQLEEEQVVHDPLPANHYPPQQQQSMEADHSSQRSIDEEFARIDWDIIDWEALNEGLNW